MRRREFIAALGGAAAWPLAALAQQALKIRTIGFLNPTVPVFTENNSVFSNGLRELGWIEGQNIAIERRPAETMGAKWVEVLKSWLLDHEDWFSVQPSNCALLHLIDCCTAQPLAQVSSRRATY